MLLVIVPPHEGLSVKRALRHEPTGQRAFPLRRTWLLNFLDRTPVLQLEVAHHHRVDAHGTLLQLAFASLR